MYDLRILLVWMVLGFLLYLITIRPERQESGRKKSAKEPGDVKFSFGWDRKFTQAENNMIESLREYGFMETYTMNSDEIIPQPMGLLSRELMLDLGVAPLRMENDVLVVAMVDPFDLNAVDIVREIANREIKPVIIAEKDLCAIIGEKSGS